MIDTERERKRFNIWLKKMPGLPDTDEQWLWHVWRAAKEQAAKETAALREYADMQCCECHDEWGNKKPHRCHRCRVLHLDATRENPRP